MSRIQRIFLSIVILLAIVFLGFFLLKVFSAQPPTAPSDSPVGTSSGKIASSTTLVWDEMYCYDTTSETRAPKTQTFCSKILFWEKYTNTKYGYSVVSPIFEGSRGPTQSDDYEKIAEGTQVDFRTGAGVDATAYFPTSLDLEDFAQKIYGLQISDKNPYTKNRHLGELTTTAVAGRRAYQFTMDTSFAGSSGGYAIPTGWTYMYVITETPTGQKLIIYYRPGDKTSEKVFHTFEFQ